VDFLTFFDASDAPACPQDRDEGYLIWCEVHALHSLERMQCLMSSSLLDVAGDERVPGDSALKGKLIEHISCFGEHATSSIHGDKRIAKVWASVKKPSLEDVAMESRPSAKVFRPSTIFEKG
jgi:hypothetical protein